VEQAQLNLEWTKVTSLVMELRGLYKSRFGNLVGSNFLS